jgi:hypothetical protein
LREESGKELVTSAKILCNHLLVAAIEKQNTEHNETMKGKSGKNRYICKVHTDTKKIVLIFMKVSQILVHILTPFKLQCSYQEK